MGLMQEALDRSLTEANDFTRAMYADQTWSDDEVISFVSAARSATIASANAEGIPHAAVVIAACHEDEHIYFTVTPSTVLSRNIVARPQIAFSICFADKSVKGQGVGVLVGRALELPDLVQALGAPGSGHGFVPPEWDGLIYRIDVRRIFTG